MEPISAAYGPYRIGESILSYEPRLGKARLKDTAGKKLIDWIEKLTSIYLLLTSLPQNYIFLRHSLMRSHR